MPAPARTHSKPRLGPTNNPGRAFWCDKPEHMRLECTGQRRRGMGRCHGPAIRGTPHCKLHGGVKREVALAKGQARITAWTAIGEPDGGKHLDAGMAVLGMLQMTWLRAAAYGDLLRRQVESELPTPDPEGFNPEHIVKSDGLVGYRYGAAGKDGHIYAVSEEARALVALEAAERDRVVKFAKTAHDMGISDRITSLAERWGDVVVTRIMVLLEALDLTPEQEDRVPALIQAHLGQIELGSGGSAE